jgi:glucose/arabinose dehydrogenase
MKLFNFQRQAMPGFFKIVLVTAIFLGSTLLLQNCKKTFNEKEGLQKEDLSGGLSSRDHDRQVDIKLIADSLTSPLGVVTADDDSKRLFIIDQIGKIWIVDRHGNRLTTPFLDITSKVIPLNPNGDERGMLGVAFHPRYKHNGKLYVYYMAPRRPGGPTPSTLWNNLSKLSEFKVSAGNPNMADPNSERAVLEIDDPQGNHNGGSIAFGPKDDYLYIAIGDGGGANDINVGHVTDWYLPNAGGNGQDLDSNLFGNILRIDINGIPYRIPADNPFVNKPGKDEIYAYGLRNPYRFSFDMKGNNDLYVGDVGQLLYEEINVIKKGGNYGWNVKEGLTCFNAASSLNPFANCPGVDNLGKPLIDPVIVLNNFRHPAGGRTLAIIGGNVYRGNDIEHFRGKYIFGTYTQLPTTTNGELFITQPSSSTGLWTYEEVSLKSSPNDIGNLIKGFGQDRKGEIYVTTSLRLGPVGNTGKVYKLVEADDEDDDD